MSKIILKDTLFISDDISKTNEWLKKEQGRHFCACGCKKPIKLLKSHYWKGIPKYKHGHHHMAMTRRVQEFKEKGYYTVGEVAKLLGIGQTTIRRNEGRLFPMAEKRVGRNGMRLFGERQVEEMRKRFVSPQV